MKGPEKTSLKARVSLLVCLRSRYAGSWRAPTRTTVPPLPQSPASPTTRCSTAGGNWAQTFTAPLAQVAAQPPPILWVYFFHFSLMRARTKRNACKWSEESHMRLRLSLRYQFPRWLCMCSNTTMPPCISMTRIIDATLAPSTASTLHTVKEKKKRFEVVRLEPQDGGKKKKKKQIPNRAAPKPHTASQQQALDQ